MSDITPIEHKVLEAFDNESLTCTREQREAFAYQVNAFRNAAVYADQWGFDVEEFRRTITKLSGVTARDLDEF